MKTDNYERSLIGAILIDYVKILFLCDKHNLQSDDFSDPQMWRMFEDIKIIRSKPKAVVDYTSVQEFGNFHKRPVDSKIFDAIIDNTICGNAEYYIHEIKKASAWRKVEKTLKTTLEHMNNRKFDDANAVMASMNRELASLTSTSGIVISRVGDYIERNMQKWQQAKEVGFSGVPLSIPTLNTMIGGWNNGKLGVVAGETSLGKSTFVRGDALWQAKKGYGVIYITLEDPAELCDALYIGNHVNISTFQLNIGGAADWQLEKMRKGANDLKDIPLFTVSKCQQFNQIESAIRTIMSQHRIDIIYIDHLQIIQPQILPHMNRVATISTYTSRFSLLAQEIEKPIILVSQFSRDKERVNREPELSDLKEASSIEQDARQVILLWQDKDAPFQMAKVAKNNEGKRNVKTPIIRVSGLRFEDYQQIKQKEDMI